MKRSRTVSIAGRVLLAQLVAALLIGGIILAVLAVDAQRAAEEDAASTSLAVSRTIAVDPRVRDGVESPDPTGALQPYALELVDSAGVDFVTIMSPDGIRFTHPDPTQIGQPFRGTIADAQRGEELTETYTGTLGPSVRAVVPIERDGDVIGIVSAGVTTENVGASVLRRIPFVLGIAVLVVLVGTAGAVLAQRGLRRATGGLAPAELEQMVGYYESVLHSVREGLLLTDREHRVVLYNDEAAELLGLAPAAEARLPETAEALGIGAEIAELLSSGRRVVEESHLGGGTLLLVNQEAASAPGRSSSGGSVMTLRDQSRLQQLVGELDSVRSIRDSLRSQAHEHANTVHTLVSLLELGRVDQAIELASESTRLSQLLADGMVATVEHPVLGALLLSKAAQAHERGVDLRLAVDDDAVPLLSPAGLVSVVGNLVDNGIEAALASAAPRWVRVELRSAADGCELRVSDSGSGVADDDRDRVFERGVTSKPDAGSRHGHGLAVVRDAVAAVGGSVAFAEGGGGGADGGAGAGHTTVVARFPSGRAVSAGGAA